MLLFRHKRRVVRSASRATNVGAEVHRQIGKVICMVDAAKDCHFGHGESEPLATLTELIKSDVKDVLEPVRP